MKKIESLIVVGSSGAGKTTLVNGLRDHPGIIVPKRYITRPERLGDDLTENAHVDHAIFQAKVNAGEINPHWKRYLGREGEDERYGFEPVAPEDDRLRVYSANNAFLRGMNQTVAKILRRGLVVVVMARPESRDDRLGVRSPDMSDVEREIRLQDSGADMLDVDVPLEIIDTTNLSPDEGQAAIRKIAEPLIP